MDKQHIGYDFKKPIPTEYELTLRNKRFLITANKTESRVPAKKVSKPKKPVLSKQVSELDDVLLDNKDVTAAEADGDNPSGWGLQMRQKTLTALQSIHS